MSTQWPTADKNAKFYKFLTFKKNNWILPNMFIIFCLPKLDFCSDQKTVRRKFYSVRTNYVRIISQAYLNNAIYGKPRLHIFKCKLVQLSGYSLEGCNSKIISDIILKFQYLIFEVITYRNFQNNRLVFKFHTRYVP